MIIRIYEKVFTQALVLYFTNQRGPFAVLLVPELGVCRVFFKKNNIKLSVGMHISLWMQQVKAGGWRGSDVAGLFFPSSWIQEDLLFLHHLAEITMNFVFSIEDAAVVWDLWQGLFLRDSCDIEDVELKKLMILGSFFLRIGQYVPFDQVAVHGELDQYTVTSRVFADGNELNSGEKKRRIKMWLRLCICSCEPGYALRTIHFLNA